MDSASPTKYSFAFILAILFHLILIALFLLALSFESEVKVPKPIAAMQATILDVIPSAEKHETDLLVASVPAKRLSRAEKKRLAHAKKQAVRLEKLAKEKLLAAAAQQLLVNAIQGKKHEAQLTVEIEKKKTENVAESEKVTLVQQAKVEETVAVTKIAQQKNFEEAEKIKQEAKAKAKKRKQQNFLRAAEVEKKKIEEEAAQAERNAAREKKRKKVAEQKRVKATKAEKIQQELIQELDAE